MIKTKIQYKIFDYSRSSLEHVITIAAMDDYELCSPLFNHHTTVVATMVREVKVTKESLPEMIINDFKSEVGTVNVEANEGSVKVDDVDRRMIALRISEKVDQFIKNTARRYEIDEGIVDHILLNRAEDLTWFEDE